LAFYPIRTPKTLTLADILKVKDLKDRHDIVFLDEPKHIAFEKPKIKITEMRTLNKSKKKFEFRIISDTLVKALNLQIRGAKGAFGDNCFDMMPRIERRVEVTLEKPAKTRDLLKRIGFAYYR